MSETTRWLPLVPETNYSRKPIIELQAIINFLYRVPPKKMSPFYRATEIFEIFFLRQFSTASDVLCKFQRNYGDRDLLKNRNE